MIAVERMGRYQLARGIRHMGKMREVVRTRTVRFRVQWLRLIDPLAS